MGEVWKARDGRLQRDVALKILPDEFSSDVERVARFEREARLLASLNHPNIAAILGLEDFHGQQVLVLELVEGDTLAQLLARHPISYDEALDFARQIADAVEAAHEAGVIHRDLKPANIKVTPDGRVKVLDFGLAKALAGESAALNLSHSPTLSLAATQQGVILGTAAYMSPEQARGTFVDKRADIWAFGCLLFEMLSGSRAFDGELMSDVMASVLKTEPDYAALPPAIGPRMRALVTRCLQKDPKKRWRDMGDIRVELETLRSSPDTDAAGAAPSRPSSRLRERVLWLAALLATAAVTALVAARFSSSRSSVREDSDGQLVRRFSIQPPDGTSFYAGGWIVPLALSPNGRWLAFTATSDDGRSRVWIRAMASDTAQVIPGTEGALNPFWSPDSEWLGFQVLNAWYRVRVPAGTPETISAFNGFGVGAVSVAWGNDVILFSGSNGALFRVPVQGGQPSQLTTIDASAKERGHGWPQFLSDGQRFLYLAGGATPRVVLDSIDGGQRRVVMEMKNAGSTLRFAPGYLLFVEDMVLWAQPFDESNGRLTGERRRIVGGMPLAGGTGASAFSVSRAGTLAYWTQPLIQQAAQLQWIDRKGNRLGLVGSPAVYDGFDISPSGSQLASARVGRNGIELWVQDLGSASSSFPVRVSTQSTVPVWAPDGRRLAYLCGGALCLATADAAAPNPTRLTDPTRNQLAQDWTSSGDALLYENWNDATGIDLVVLDLKTKRVDRLSLNTTSNEFGGRLSPDNRWLAYVTDQTGRPEVWVAAFPSGQPRRQISQGSGTHPSWKADGTELYFISSDGQLTAVPFRGRDGIDAGEPVTLFRIPGTIDVIAGSHNVYKAGRDGQRFLVAVKSNTTGVPPINVVVNWPKLLAQP